MAARRFVASYAAANAAGFVVAGVLVCGAQIPTFEAHALLLGIALASAQSLLLWWVDARVRYWLPFTVIGAVAGVLLALGGGFLYAAVVGTVVRSSVFAGLDLYLLGGAIWGLSVGGMQLGAFGYVRGRIVASWLAANAIAAVVITPVGFTITFGCGPSASWFDLLRQSPVGWLAAGAVLGALTGPVLVMRRRPSA